MKAGWTISAIGHVAVLTWGLVTFVGRPLPQPPAEFFADVISDAELSQITKGVREAKQAEQPKPLVEKVAEAKPGENPNAKVVEKREVVPTADQPQPKPEEPKKAEPKKVEPKSEQKQAFAKEEPKQEPKPDPIADALKKDEAKKSEKK